MALIKCKECQKEISNKAAACPHCGSPAKQKRSGIGCGTVVLAFIIFGLVLSVIGSFTAESERRAQEEAARASAQRAAAAREEKLERFRADPKPTLEKAKQLAENQKWAEVVALLSPFLAANNADVQQLHDNALEQKLLSEVARIPAANAKANLDYYEQLLELKPNNRSYAQKRDIYKAKWNDLQAKEAAERLLFGNVPQKSAWDGSYPEVKQYLRQTAHDPESIEFVGCTKVFKNENGWLVGCQYRGNNAFGAKILAANWFRIQRGRVVETYESDAFTWQ